MASAQESFRIGSRDGSARVADGLFHYLLADEQGARLPLGTDQEIMLALSAFVSREVAPDVLVSADQAGSRLLPASHLARSIRMESNHPAAWREIDDRLRDYETVELVYSGVYREIAVTGQLYEHMRQTDPIMATHAGHLLLAQCMTAYTIGDYVRVE